MEIKQFSRERSGVKGFPNHVSFMPTHYNTKALPEAKDVGFPDGQCRRLERLGFNPWVGKIPWRRAWQPTPVFLPGESRGQRKLVGYSP